MAQSVSIPLGITSIQDPIEKPTKTYKLDLDAGRIISYVDGQMAVQQAIRKAIITPRFRCLIYSNQYGSEVETAIIASDVTREYVEAAVPGFIKDALAPDTRVLDLNNFEFDFKDDGCYISFDADTIYGKVRIEETI